MPGNKPLRGPVLRQKDLNGVLVSLEQFHLDIWVFSRGNSLAVLAGIPRRPGKYKHQFTRIT